MLIHKKRQGSSCEYWEGQSCFHDKVLRKLYGQSYYINKSLGNTNNHLVPWSKYSQQKPTLLQPVPYFYFSSHIK